MKLGKPELVERGQEVQIRASVEWEGRKEYLWYAVERPYAGYLTTERLDAFVVGLLLPAMAAGEDIRVEGPMSEKLHWNLTHYYMRIMSSVNPALRPVHIIAAERYNRRPTPAPVGVATGFSAGIDSFCVLADHFFGDVSPGYKLTHLIFNNVGSHLQGARTLFLNRYERLRPCADSLDLPFIRIDSNLDDFFQLRFGHSHSPRNASAVLALQGLFHRYLYASAYRYEDCFVHRAQLPAYADPMAIPLLSTETMECISTGSQYSRVEKTAKVAEIPLSYEYLDVCYHGVDCWEAGNCSVCKKCVRTLLTFELLGKAHLYKKVFALDRYVGMRHRFMAKTVGSDDPLLKEIAHLAKTQGRWFPLRATVTGISRRIMRRIKDNRPWRRTRKQRRS